jgi:hypothetical protein
MTAADVTPSVNPRDVAYVFAFGGVMALASVFATRQIPPTLHEVQYKARLREGAIDDEVSDTASTVDDEG